LETKIENGKQKLSFGKHFQNTNWSKYYRLPSGQGKLEKISAFDWSGTVREKWEVREK